MGDTALLAVVVAALAVIVNAAVSIGLHIRRARFEEALATKKLDYDAALAERKLRLDLFDKRYAIFDAARTFLGKALTGTVEMKDEQAFVSGTLDASFLLNDELATYLDEILRRVLDLPFKLNDLQNEQATDQERKAAAEAYGADRKWLREQYKVVVTKFRPFLHVDG